MKNFNSKKAVQPLIFVVIVGAILAIGYATHNNSGVLQTRNVHGKDINYEVKYSQDAKQSDIKGTTVLQGKDPVSHAEMMMAVTKAVKSDSDCLPDNASSASVRIVSQPVIDGRKHNLCYATQQNVYGMNFNHKGQWYVFTLFSKDGTSVISASTAADIAGSLKLN